MVISGSPSSPARRAKTYSAGDSMPRSFPGRLIATWILPVNHSLTAM